ncbi:sodium/potassium/calcium exchanger 3-like [Stylophora pistillata]|uniref:sodium/potassium/calcium exchanger 3-like n=1 Tax=Stylophora pistillata TaxID=50429 RepID=UPI000C04EFD8|nr:sodium/potassium/calcium exchanger 3-like [Stylophora pistillata]
MKRGKNFLTRFAILVMFPCFMYPSLLYKSITSSTTDEISSEHRGSARVIRSVEFDETETTGRVQLEATSTSPQNCVKPSIDDFPNDFMTQYQRQKQGGVVIHFLLAIYMFGALASVCDDYFVPSLEQITNKLHMDSDVAGATFMAAGSSAPELFTSIIGVFITKSDIGLGTIVGSAVFNILFIVAVCGLFAGTVLRLTPWPLLRDSFCYLLSIAALIAISYDQNVYWYEAIVLVIMYLLYVIIMYFDKTLEKCFERWTGMVKVTTDVAGKKRRGDEQRSLLKEEDEHEETASAAGEQEEVMIVNENDDSPFTVPPGLFARVLWILALPVTCLFYVTIPDCRKERWEQWYLVSFFLSVMWIAILSYILVWMVSIIGFTLGIPDVIMGLTFLAAGSSVPDGISSLIVARQGDGDMAVSNTIGSNVFDILLCLGLPWLLKTTAVDLGGYVVVLSGSIIYTSISLFGTVFVTIFLVVANKWYLNKCLGMAFLLLYILFITVATLFELNLFGNYNMPTCKT